MKLRSGFFSFVCRALGLYETSGKRCDGPLSERSNMRVDTREALRYSPQNRVCLVDLDSEPLQIEAHALHRGRGLARFSNETLKASKKSMKGRLHILHRRRISNPGRNA